MTPIPVTVPPPRNTTPASDSALVSNRVINELAAEFISEAIKNKYMVSEEWKTRIASLPAPQQNAFKERVKSTLGEKNYANIKFGKAKPQSSETGKTDSTFASLLTNAEQGDAQAQYDVGVRYAKGDGVASRSSEAVKWYRKAAEQGHAEAQYQLSRHYRMGLGINKDNVESIKWLGKAAEQGHEQSKTEVGAPKSVSDVKFRITDQTVLADVAQNHWDSELRLAATEKLMTQSVLADIAQNEKDSKIRIVAIKKLTDQTVLSGVAQNHWSDDLRIAAFKNLTDQNVLANNVTNASNYKICKAAIENLTDQNVLGYVDTNLV